MLTPDIDGVVVALGGNDLLRGFDPDFTKNNLDKIFMKLKSKGKGQIIINFTSDNELNRLLDIFEEGI